MLPWFGGPAQPTFFFKGSFNNELPVKPLESSSG